MMLEPLGEVGANFSLQLSSRTQFTKINTIKVIAENQCEKHKKSSFFLRTLWSYLQTAPYPSLKCKNGEPLLEGYQVRGLGHSGRQRIPNWDGSREETEFVGI